MFITGLQAFSLSDFPGRVSAILFTQGCNFRCPFCHNGDLIPLAPPMKPMPDEAIDSFLHKRRGRIEGIVISGGEPTLHADLPDFLARIKTLEYAVKLDTNGSRPQMLKTLIDAGLVDYIAMDVKAPWPKYTQLTGVDEPLEPIRESIALIAQSAIACEFRTTVYPPLLGEEDLICIRELIPPGALHRIQSCRKANGSRQIPSLI
jgi:pyruvate formate lyase activating enzyme